MKKIVSLLIVMLLVVVAVNAQTSESKRKPKPTTTQTAAPKPAPKPVQTTTPKPAPKPTTLVNKVVSNGNGYTVTINGVTFNMVYVQGGTFTMGATSEQGSNAGSDEKPTHSVTLSSFSIGETEVTQALWQAVMGESATKIANRIGRSTRGVGSNYPMYYISWNDCQTFISKSNNLLSSQLGGKRFRLPTEAEWEYAARGGNKSKGYKYSGSNSIGDVAWYDRNSNQTHPVKQKQPNELGIYDMSGNVWEWCSDWYSSYSDASQSNPTGPSSGYSRVYRGGSWLYNDWRCRSSYRHYYDPGIRYYDLGLRLVLSE